MKVKKTINSWGLLWALSSAALVACGGEDGAQGPAGPAGPPGPPGPGVEDGGDPTLLCTRANDASVTPGQPMEVDADDDDVAPAPPSIGADVPVTYFGPAPSDSNPRLIGPVQLLTAGQLDLDAGYLTLPLYRGEVAGGPDDGTVFWYIVTDTTDADNARALGLNLAQKLRYADFEGSRAVRRGQLVNTNGELVPAPVAPSGADTILVVEDTSTSTNNPGVLVDFAPERIVTPGAAPNFFPPTAAEPGSIGQSNYSPLVRIENAGGHIYNAPIVAVGPADAYAGGCDAVPDRTLVHDSVARICPDELTVTLELVPGFSFGRPIFYLSTDTNRPDAAALEAATFAPGLVDIPVGSDDSLFSPVERLFLTVNGPGGADNPQRQGLNSALGGEGPGPLNVLGGIPTLATDYSPLWDVNIGEWTQDAIDRGYRARVTEEFQILGLVVQGHITGPGGSAYGSSGLIVNCPIVHRFL